MAKKKDYSKPVGPMYARNLRSKAKVGSPEVAKAAYEELVARNKALAGVANRRLTNLEKAGFERWAYDRAITHIESIDGKGASRFNKNLTDIVDLQLNIQEMSKFLNSKSSTVAGNRDIDKEIINAFRNKSINLGEDVKFLKIKKVDVNAFIDIIKSDAWEELKKYHVSSEALIDDMIRLSNLTENKVSWEQVLNEYEKVASGDITYDVALENLGVPF